MLKKLRILSSNIPREYNEGFIIDYKKNRIVNISKNYSIRIPFKIIKSDIFSFELLIENSSVNLNFILDTTFIRDNSYNFEYIENKTYIFSILKCAFKNRPITNNINRFYDLKDIISKKANYILRDNIINIDNLYFNLEKECIFSEDNSSLVYLKPKLCILYGSINNYNKPKNYKLCIVDDKYKLDNSNLIISFDNYESLTEEHLNSVSTIGICREFFISNEYVKMYKYFHSNHSSEYAFDNFKSYYNNSESKKIYNLELLDNIIFIINNVSKKLLIKHPVINSDNYILIISKKVTMQDLNNSYKLLNYKYKSSKINTDIIMNYQVYYDRNKFLLSKHYNSPKTTTISTKYYFNDGIINKFSVFHDNIEIECPISRECIKKETHVKFNCGHVFCYEGLDQYLNINQNCPYCKTPIKSSDIKFYSKNVMNKILNYDNLDNRDIYLFYKKSSEFIEFITKHCFSSFKLDNELISIEIEPNSILVIDNDIDEYEFSNLTITNPNILNTIELIKLKFYY